MAFLAGVRGSLEREFYIAAYLNLGQVVDVTSDASPWGVGATLRIGGVIKE